MKHFVEVKEITFSDYKTSDDNKNYPESGLYLVSVEVANQSDLRFVNKSYPTNHCICPASIYDGLNLKIEALPKVETEELKQEIHSGFVSENFVLEFSKILLNKK